MRIITGKFKGQHLCSFSSSAIRPMTDRVKTSLFNVLYSLQGGVEGQRVLDLFSGTGNLALEALSRGAEEVYMVDSYKKAIQIIKKNLKLLNNTKAFKKTDLLKSESLTKKSKTIKKNNLNFNKIKIYQKDVFRFLSSYKGAPFDLIFADPPFKKHYGERILKSCASSQAVGRGTILVLEISTQEFLTESPEDSAKDSLKNSSEVERDKLAFLRRHSRVGGNLLTFKGMQQSFSLLKYTFSRPTSEDSAKDSPEQTSKKTDSVYILKSKKEYGDKKLLFYSFT